MNIKEGSKIEMVPECFVNPNRVLEIKFDCVLTMSDYGNKLYKGSIFGEGKADKYPQWFKSQYQLTLETIKYGSEHDIGSVIKQMFYELEKTIEQYERPI